MPKGGLSRRKLLTIAAASAVAPAAKGLTLIAGSQQPRALVPADKGITPAMFRAMRRRGKPRVVTGADLDRIGMPIGGICCGQVYLSGEGQLWHWDVFNLPTQFDIGKLMGGENYMRPLQPKSPFRIEASVFVGRSEPVPLTRERFKRTTFIGKNPMAEIAYGELGGVSISLEAFSPFIPLNETESGLPCTVLRYRLKNQGAEPKTAGIQVELDNPVCLASREWQPARLKGTAFEAAGAAGLEFGAIPDPNPDPTLRDDVLFENWESGTYAGWKVEGTAFGASPQLVSKMPSYMGELNATGRYVVNTHQARNGEDVVQADRHLGKLTSGPFVLSRKFINFKIGGGNHPGKTCVNLVVGGNVVRSATGRNSNFMHRASFDVAEFEGQTATIQVVDELAGGWGQISVDEIVFSDRPRRSDYSLAQEMDFGTFAVAALADDVRVKAESESGSVRAAVSLAPGEERVVTLIVSWHFPNPNRQSLGFLQGSKTFTHFYAKAFESARAVATYVARHGARLYRETRLWTDTWYGSTLPYWFLDRTFANTSILASATCMRFDSGRFYGWEGIYCCAGTCTHVWQYAQAVGRIFPELERDTRERVDLGIAWHADGMMGHRAEAWQDVAIDGQCGTILRIYREHQMSANREFLTRNWAKTKQAIEYLIRQDANDDGMLEGAQMNTLDAVWYGKIAWISGMYVATLRAGEAMAKEVGDLDFATRCGRLAASGTTKIEAELWNGEYFIHKVDPRRPETINTNDGCHIDQVFGQSWAHQLGLPRVFSPEKSCKALKALFRYSFAPDVGKYREANKEIPGGRWYAMPGESGLLMCTWPQGSAGQAAGADNKHFAVGYFNECMSGFEYQAAAHMIYEGLVDEGLAVVKAINDRYDASRRNPYNEIECSDHYARAMASYGCFLAVCGWSCNGPEGEIRFAPKISPENFRAAFTCASGWGTISQRRSSGRHIVELIVKWGSVRLRTLNLETSRDGASASAALDGVPIRVSREQAGAAASLKFPDEVHLNAGQSLRIEL